MAGLAFARFASYGEVSPWRLRRGGGDLGLEEKFVIVLTTLPAEGDAERFATQLVQERLAACVNLLPPMQSVYRWKDAIEKADERQIVIKTTRTRLGDLEARIRQLHPYDVPEFVVLSIDSGSADYLSWLIQNTAQSG